VLWLSGRARAQISGTRFRRTASALSRPFVNASPVPIAATVALETIGPIPGTLIKVY
jgi:hypothetical protein